MYFINIIEVGDSLNSYMGGYYFNDFYFGELEKFKSENVDIDFLNEYLTDIRIEISFFKNKKCSTFKITPTFKINIYEDIKKIEVEYFCQDAEFEKNKNEILRIVIGLYNNIKQNLNKEYEIKYWKVKNGSYTAVEF